MPATSRDKDKDAKPAPALTKLSREPLHDRVYKELRRALMAAQFTPGEQLTLRTTAEMLGVSVMPVRAAFNKLVAERALTLLANGSIIVPEMSAARFEELIEIRKMLEGEAAKKAAKLISAEELDDLAKIGEDLTEAGNADSGERYLDLNWRFKFTVYKASQSPELLNLIEAVWLQFGPFMHNYAKDVRLQARDDCHDEILAALRARDGSAARRAMQADIDGGAKYLASVASFSE